MTTTGFTPDMVAAILIRDGALCSICAGPAEIANHRANRGHGGYRAANRPSNGVAICHRCNGLIEDDTPERHLALARGVKISRYDDPEVTACWSPLFRMMVFFHDDWRLEFADARGKLPMTNPPGFETATGGSDQNDHDEDGVMATSNHTETAPRKAGIR